MRLRHSVPLGLRGRVLCGLMFVSSLALCATAQSVTPLISEYTAHAAGFFEVTNSSITPSIVVLEPKSFSIDPEGNGNFRPLDPGIHLELSATSLRLEPHQSARIFYKVWADNVPAWLCVYSSFSPVKKVEGINLRIMLPHTIYVYQKDSLSNHNIEIESVRFDEATHRVLCELTNTSSMAGRAQSVEVTGKHSSASLGGFPMLPHERRILSVDWTSAQPPQSIDIEFEHFSLKRPVEE